MSTESFQIVYNAKNVSAEKVAESFILHPEFDALLKNNHTVLLGARGCGKTTLMKMLTLPALNQWKHPRAEQIRNNLPFVAVYIPTDIYWNTNNDALYDDLAKRFPSYAQAVSEASVALRVLNALLITFLNIIKYEQLDNSKANSEFSKLLIEEWRLAPAIPELERIEGYLAKMVNRLASHIKYVIYNYKSEDEINYTEPFFKINFQDASEVAITEFIRIFKYNKYLNWAFCFDELEIAPEWLQRKLFTQLRSLSKQNILYKLSSSPISSAPEDTLASSTHDVTLIKMWPHENPIKYEEFSKQIISNILLERFNKDVDPEKIFGSNHLYSKKSINEYNKDGITWREIKNLALVDKSFSDYLTRNGLNPEDPSVSSTNKNKLDSVLRKIKPIVFFRSYYREYKELKIKKEKKSRKANTLYYGKEVIYKICDGNPRWLKGLMDMMLMHIKDDRIKKIKESDQALELTQLSERFLNSVEVYPKPSLVRVVNNKTDKIYTLKDIIIMIGDFFQKDLLGKNFKAEPYGTFLVDNKIPSEINTIIKKAAYQGAFILVNPSMEGFDKEAKGKQFRLAYLFAPKFNLPVRKNKLISLSSAIEILISKQDYRSRNNSSLNQISLFNNKTDHNED